MLKFIAASLVVGVVAAFPAFTRSGQALASTEPAPGQLTILDKEGKPGNLCPLEKTRVVADIAGFGARVTVTQSFVNPSTEPIEAVYTFPLPADAAVDRMRMKIGDRIIEGQIKRREEARQIYDAARAAGQTASLLDQERPNIFTQSVANIVPKARVEIEISYVQVLKYEEGQFEFMFPMVVGPRFLGNAPDPAKISPPITPKATRTGTNVDLTVNIEAGAGLREVRSTLHAVSSSQNGSRAQIKLAKRDEIPNRDFILRYRTSTDSVQSAFITHMDPAKGGFFTLILTPPKRPTAAQIAPREMIFVVDQSGSQSGFPLEKSKELTLKMIRTLRPGDTFNVVGFNNIVVQLWAGPRPFTSQNYAEAETFIKNMQANGGTQLRAGVEAALTAPNDPGRLRLVVFNTDGYVGDEIEVLKAIAQNRSTSRMFTFGIGNSVNRYLIDSMSLTGRGDSEVVTLNANSDAAAGRFAKRTQSPILTGITVKVDGIPVEQMLPSQIPDVFDDKPIVVYGRYSQAGPARITVEGQLGSEPWSQTLEVNFGASESAPSLMSLWARRKVDELSFSKLYPVDGEGTRTTEDQVTQAALEFGIMSESTSFVAVETKVVNVGGKQRRVAVPVEMADGVSYEMEGSTDKSAFKGRMLSPPGGLARAGLGQGGGGFGGGGGSTGSGRGGTTGATTGSTTGAAANKAAAPPSTLQYVTADALTEAATIPERKFDPALLKLKGPIEVQIWVSEVSAKVLAELKKAGFKVDSSDKGLRVVFGTLTAKQLAAVAKVSSVRRISRLP